MKGIKFSFIDIQRSSMQSFMFKTKKRPSKMMGAFIFKKQVVKVT
ncbi:hypothetical protein MTsN1n28_36730 [Vibrio alginolyticus]|jgi:hypothetical protein